MLDIAERVLEMSQEQMRRQCKVGIHARNAVWFRDIDYQLLRVMKAESIKMMSYTALDVFERIKREFPNILFVVRVYDTDLQNGFFDQKKHPMPEHYFSVIAPKIKQIHRVCGAQIFEIHNEPNHNESYEGWGDTEEHAKSFNDWFIDVRNRLKNKFDWIEVMFPGLAIPHNDLLWKDWCEEAINLSDCLGVHAYWQYANHLHDRWGLVFKHFHEKYPDKDIHLTEVGNTDIHRGVNTPEDTLAQQYIEYYKKCFEYDYIKSVHPFLMSSSDKKNWDYFSWVTEGNHFKAQARAIGSLERD